MPGLPDYERRSVIEADPGIEEVLEFGEEEPEEVAEIARLVECGQLRDAREALQRALDSHSTSPKLLAWAKALAPPGPIHRRQSSDTGFQQNESWLEEHAKEYRGHWVALRIGCLLGFDEDRLTLHRKLRQEGKLAGAVFMRL